MKNKFLWKVTFIIWNITLQNLKISAQKNTQRANNNTLHYTLQINSFKTSRRYPFLLQPGFRRQFCVCALTFVCQMSAGRWPVQMTAAGILKTDRPSVAPWACVLPSQHIFLASVLVLRRKTAQVWVAIARKGLCTLWMYYL